MLGEDAGSSGATVSDYDHGKLMHCMEGRRSNVKKVSGLLPKTLNPKVISQLQLDELLVRVLKLQNVTLLKNVLSRGKCDEKTQLSTWVGNNIERVGLVFRTISVELIGWLPDDALALYLLSSPIPIKPLFPAERVDRIRGKMVKQGWIRTDDCEHLKKVSLTLSVRAGRGVQLLIRMKGGCNALLACPTFGPKDLAEAEGALKEWIRGKQKDKLRVIRDEIEPYVLAFLNARGYDCKPAKNLLLKAEILEHLKSAVTRLAAVPDHEALTAVTEEKPMQAPAAGGGSGAGAGGGAVVPFVPRSSKKRPRRPASASVPVPVPVPEAAVAPQSPKDDDHKRVKLTATGVGASNAGAGSASRDSVPQASSSSALYGRMPFHDLFGEEDAVAARVLAGLRTA